MWLYFSYKQEKMSSQPSVSEVETQSKKPTSSNKYEAAKHDFAWVKGRLEEENLGKKLIFVKDMVQGIDGHYNALPDGYRHTFLIRHPYKVFESLKNMWSKAMSVTRLPEMAPLLAPGYFFKEMYDLVEYLKKERVEPQPIIIDADDLLANTPGIMKAYCEAVGIPYSDALLNWPAGGDAMLSKWMCAEEFLKKREIAHESTFASTGFGKPSPIPDRANLPEDVLEVADASMQYYEQLFEQRLKC